MGQNRKPSGTKNLAKSLKRVATTVADVAESLDLEAQRRKERAAKYPECEKLSHESGRKRELLNFIEWLRDEKKIELADSTSMDRNGYLDPIPAGDSHLERIVHAYLEIDSVALEKERRAMLDELQEKASAD